MLTASGEKQNMVENQKRSRVRCCRSASAGCQALLAAFPRRSAKIPMLGGSLPGDRQTAVYDISAHTVYLPDGTRPEAHPARPKLDDRACCVRRDDWKVTPPHIYESRRRAKRCSMACSRLVAHAIGGEDKIFGCRPPRITTYMLGSNGDPMAVCRSRITAAVFNAYRNHGIRRLAVPAGGGRARGLPPL